VVRILCRYSVAAVAFLFVLNVFSVLSNSVPYVVVQYYERQVNEDNTRKLKSTEDIVQEDMWHFYQNCTLAVGLFLASLFCLQIITRQLSQISGKASHQLSQISEKAHGLLALVLSTSNVRGESRLKMAAVRKVNTMLHNARELHQFNHADALVSGSDERGVSDQAMRNFVLRGERSELSCGMFWTWRRLLNGSLFHTEGIWINTRLITIQVAQFLVGTVFSIILLVSVQRIADEAQAGRDSLNSSMPQWVYDIMPTAQMIYLSLYPATFVAMLVMVLLFLLYIPRYETQTSLVCFHHSTFT
jgi:hypothetical protein